MSEIRAEKELEILLKLYDRIQKDLETDERLDTVELEALANVIKAVKALG